MAARYAAGTDVPTDRSIAFLVLPGGQTVSDAVRPGIAEAYASGQVPALLPDYPRAITTGGN